MLVIEFKPTEDKLFLACLIYFQQTVLLHIILRWKIFRKKWLSAHDSVIMFILCDTLQTVVYVRRIESWFWRRSYSRVSRQHTFLAMYWQYSDQFWNMAGSFWNNIWHWRWTQAQKCNANWSTRAESSSQTQCMDVWWLGISGWPNWTAGGTISQFSAKQFAERSVVCCHWNWCRY